MVSFSGGNMTENENEAVKHFDSILFVINADLEKKYFTWLKTQVREIKLTSVYTLFNKSELTQMKKELKPRVKGCYDFSLKAACYNTDITSVFGYKIFHGIFINHAISRITVNNETYYFDFISEVINKEEAPNLIFIALHEFSSDEIMYYIDKTRFLDRLPYIWFQKNIYPKKIVRP